MGFDQSLLDVVQVVEQIANGSDPVARQLRDPELTRNRRCRSGVVWRPGPRLSIAFSGQNPGRGSTSFCTVQKDLWCPFGGVTIWLIH